MPIPGQIEIPESYAPLTMKRWEYRVVDIAFCCEAHLNDLGQLGWELVCSTQNRLIFKRWAQA
jgi:hypothetical protein